MSQEQAWRDSLRSTLNPQRTPAFFFAHGSPALMYQEEMFEGSGKTGPLARFLGVFGKFITEDLKPKAIVIFSAHWETNNKIDIMSYDTNPLLYDYYGFPKEFYAPYTTFESKGSHDVAKRVKQLLEEASIPSRTIENGRGLDHGVFVPFLTMFPNNEHKDIPIVEVSMNSNLDPETEFQLGKALTPLRDENILVLSGGLTMHNLRDRASFSFKSASKHHIDFSNSVSAAVKDDPVARKEALFALTKHPGFRHSHPREEHFVPIYVAAGAGSEGGAKLICDGYGIHTIAFGL
eukprot:TRINITY_DN5521_c0_g1_i2.p1 TRINITY_DN5521_c0_g1~~TRINITY_DN5521_c0_g1_i2.p1  ORF type:complete len:304 (+),score=67.40 TRINITY_DN5521_c0_g1_i2:38-913(+)